MTSATTGRAVRLKEPPGWFAAGSGFRRSLGLLSDGAFKLFVWICLEARRDSGQLEATHKELARALGKSKRVIGRWLAELQAKGICQVEPGSNQYEPTRLRLTDSYWPYERAIATNLSAPATHSDDGDAYVAAVRDCFVNLGSAKPDFAPSDETFARELERRGVPLQTVESALLLGATRKYQSWLDGKPSAPIGSLRYFEAVIAEAAQLPFTGDYRNYLRGKLRQFAAQFALTRAAHSAALNPNGGAQK